MKILIIHRNYFIDGGDSTYTIKLANLLKANGNNVTILAMKDDRNDRSLIKLVEIPNSFADNNVTRFDELKKTAKLKYGLNSIFSFDAYKITRKLVKSEKFDIIHIQNIHHVLTSSVVYALFGVGIPVVWTLHDYKLLCPASTFFLNGAICEKCKGNKFYNAAKNKCKRDSLFGSLSVMASSYLDEVMKIKKSVDKFITPSNFLREKLIEYGFDEEKVINLPNFITQEDRSTNKRGDYILYYGNFSKEKGVDLLLKICKELVDIPFLFAGSGPLEKEVATAASGKSNIIYHSFLSKVEMKNVIRGAKMIIVPSQWYENFPFTVLEPMSFGKMVIASRIGGIPEIIINEVNGVLVNNKNSLQEWVEKIKQIYYDEDKIKEYEENAYKTILKYSAEVHISKIEALYKDLTSSKDIAI